MCWLVESSPAAGQANGSLRELPDVEHFTQTTHSCLQPAVFSCTSHYKPGLGACTAVSFPEVPLQPPLPSSAGEIYSSQSGLISQGISPIFHEKSVNQSDLN